LIARGQLWLKSDCLSRDKTLAQKEFAKVGQSCNSKPPRLPQCRHRVEKMSALRAKIPAPAPQRRLQKQK